MLPPKENELVTRVGPGTPMGNAMRRYWIPACLASEIAEPDCPPVRVKLMCEDLIAFRRQREKLIHRELALKLPTRFGEFDLFVYTSVVDPEPHLALTMGGIGVEVGGCRSNESV